MAHSIRLRINGRAVEIKADDPEMPLLYALATISAFTDCALAAASANVEPAPFTWTAPQSDPALPRFRGCAT